jgi:hypothetical protein
VNRAALVLAALLAPPILLASCTKADVTPVTTGAGSACEIVLTLVDAEYAPLCTTLEQLALAIEMALPGTSTSDAGALQTAARMLDVMQSMPDAQKRAVYDYLAAHGATPLGG